MMKKVFCCGVLFALCILSSPREAFSNSQETPSGIIIKLMDSSYTVYLEGRDKNPTVSHIDFQVIIPYKVITWPEFLVAYFSKKLKAPLNYTGFVTIEGEIQSTLPCMKDS